jgi:hypothetical protein
MSNLSSVVSVLHGLCVTRAQNTRQPAGQASLPRQRCLAFGVRVVLQRLAQLTAWPSRDKAQGWGQRLRVRNRQEVVVNAVIHSRSAVRIFCATAMLAGVAANVQAQTAGRSVRPAPQPVAPVITPGVAGPGTPSPSGLTSPLPSPAGLTSQFPAGLPSPLPSPSGLPSPTVPNLSSPGTPAGSPPIDSGVAPATSALGAAGYGGVAGPRQAPAVGGGPYTALQVAQSFIGADGNRDGELTRAEAQRLTIMPFTFEEMDSNHDGILTRSEYEEALR